MIEFLKWASVILVSLGAFCVLGFSLGSGKPFKHLLLNALLGFSSFVLINLTSAFTGVSVALNPFTAVGAGVFGMPAVCFFILADIIFKFLV